MALTKAMAMALTSGCMDPNVALANDRETALDDHRPAAMRTRRAYLALNS